MSTQSNSANPLLQSWTTPFKLPPFEQIEPSHFLPAFEAAMSAHRSEIDAIADHDATPDFANVLVALENSGRLLSQVSSVFYNLTGTDTNAALQAIERELAPKMAAHVSAIYMHDGFFGRLDNLFERRETLDLNDEERRLLDVHHKIFVRAGAKLNAADKARMSQINEQLAQITTQFSQNVLADEAGYQLVLDGEDDLAGLPQSARDGAREAAAEKGLEDGKYVITLARSSVEGFVTFSQRRDLREQAFNAWISRGCNGGKTDNSALIGKIAALRAEKAKLLGYETFAAFTLDNTMAKTPENVQALLDAVWQRAVGRAKVESADLQKLAQEAGDNFDLAPWDWRYYAEKLRKERYDLDTAQIKPYLQLDNMIAAAFDVAQRLFGLSFKERQDLPRYHPDVRLWEVHYDDDRAPALFMADYFARASKRSGAWMSNYRTQEKLQDDIRPLIINVMNFTKPAPGEPALLSFDDARTLFHEFGHALHGLLSDVTFPTLAGTSVSRDFVELPSQLYEHWLTQPQVLAKFALHAETGDPMPEDLLRRLKDAENFNMGFSTVEYTASALLDMDLHAKPLRELTDDFDVAAYERSTLAGINMPGEIVMRHRLPHFLHLFAGSYGYAAAYYSYMWSEVMDADAFDAFTDAGDIFDAKTAAKLKKHIYSAGNRVDPEQAYIAFRGRAPKIDALLKGRGLDDAA